MRGDKPPRIAVVGCGPAGMAFAITMANAGVNVQILEQAESPTAMGSGIVLQPTGLQVIDTLGLRHEIEAGGNRIKRILGHTADRERLVIDVDYRLLGSNMHAIAIQRSFLFSTLLKRLEAFDVNIATGVEVLGLQRRGDGAIELRDAGNNWLGPFDLVVDASGARSALRTQAFGWTSSKTLKFGSLWATLEMPAGVFPNDTLLQRFAPGNTSLGVMPIGCGTPGDPQRAALFWNIECARYTEWLRDGLDAWKDEVYRIWPDCELLLNQIHSQEQLTLARYRHHFNNEPHQHGIVFIGDAAHATTPQLGQGINMGLLDAATLARSIRMERDLDTACQRYARQRQPQTSVVQALARVLIPFYQSDNTAAIAIRDLGFEPLSQMPFAKLGIAKLVSGSVGQPTL